MSWNPESTNGISLPLKLLDVVVLSSAEILVPGTVTFWTCGVMISKGIFWDALTLDPPVDLSPEI